MKKYKLIKLYPGSPDLGTEVDKDTKYSSSHSYFYRSGDKRICVFNEHVEENPEYWEEVIDVWYVVLLKDGAFRNAWEVIKVQEDPSELEHKKYFKTREEAEEFIVDNKRCLSYSDLIWNFTHNTKKNSIEVDIDKLLNLIKSKL